MKQMIVQCQQQMTQMALLEEGRLVEYAAELPRKRGILGSFFKARVVNVLPGMQAAFVDIGQRKNAFLYVDDVLHAHLDKQPQVKPSISELLKVGQEIVVQVLKEAVGSKGARVTTHFSLPGRWIVYMPRADYVAVSKKIEREGERTRLKAMGEQLRTGEEGIIIRTVSEEMSIEAIENDLDQLRQQWALIQRKAGECSTPCELHRDLSIVQRLIRDVFTPEQDELVIDSVEQAKDAEIMLQQIGPAKAHVSIFRSTEETIFNAYGINEQLERDFARKVWLQGGGYIVIDHTEALTVIDVNTGKFTGGSNLEETVTRTNIEAAKEIARLVRVRDIGGIIIIDFIDMEQEENRREVSSVLEARLKKDRTKSYVVGWTRLGLLEMTRKKVREEKTLV
ncbi:Rne/Rng family ribonuclease [Paenibacillus peoriae]|uniref:Rne/Rng family ribonuclease n=1 Tax=Paenibacillus peoriae TaxID=59893 RepID=UPI00026C6688|nr:Rne/Rng family ribonuclease [Paenibacillus peoriae]MEC0182490.1 Rne/Rng family ribonuclease [Paenibacillus peoriae]